MASKKTSTKSSGGARDKARKEQQGATKKAAEAKAAADKKAGKAPAPVRNPKLAEAKKVRAAENKKRDNEAIRKDAKKTQRAATKKASSEKRQVGLNHPRHNTGPSPRP